MKLFTPRLPSVAYHYPNGLPRDGMLFPRGEDDLLGHDADITLACTFLREEYIFSLDITGGKRAALSLDNCFRTTIEGVTIDPRNSRHGLLVADNTHGLYVDGLVFDEPARGAEIVIGWRPGFVPWSAWHSTGAVTLRDVRMASGKRPVRVHVWDSEPPIVIKGNVEVRMMNPRYVRAAQWLNRKGLLP